jgi:L-xylulokinase
MATKYLLGLDNGGTVIKAALFTIDGKELAVASRSTEEITPQPGWTERDMETLWEQNCACVKEAIARAGVNAADIAGVAVCGHGKGLYPWGKNGRPAWNGIISTDNRAWKYPARWRESGIHEKLYDRLCQQFMACQQVSLLAWFNDNRPEVYDNIQWAFSVIDYVRFRLTGEAFSEATNISGSGLINVRDARVDSDILEALGIGGAVDKIPPLRYSSETCGVVTREAAERTGLREKTPVAAGMFDIDACAIAMSILKPEDFCTITGTWTINEFISKTPFLHTAIAMNSLYAVPGYYLIEDSSSTGAGCLEWVIENVIRGIGHGGRGAGCAGQHTGKALYQKLDEMVAAVPPEKSDVYFLPFLQGSNRHPLAKACWVGLTSFHTRADMLRAVYEGAAYSAKHHVDKLLSVRDKPKTARLAGGVANSPLWVQLFADILGLPIETVTGVKETGALGAAMAASIAAGVYKNFDEAAAAMTRVNPPVDPSPATKIYADKYAKYDAVCAALDTIWEKFEI